MGLTMYFSASGTARINDSHIGINIVKCSNAGGRGVLSADLADLFFINKQIINLVQGNTAGDSLNRRRI